WIGTRWPVADNGLTGMILATGRPSRQDDFIGIRGTLRAPVQDSLIRSWREMRSVVGVPIIVERSIWGIMSAAAAPGTLVPAGARRPRGPRTPPPARRSGWGGPRSGARRPSRTRPRAPPC